MKIVGVTLGWSGNPQLEYQKSDGTRGWILPYEYELKSRSKYYPDGPGSWPKNPVSGEKLAIQIEVKK